MTYRESQGFFRGEADRIFGFTGVGAPPLIIDPSHSDDVDTQMTMQHERVHQLLLRLTSFGHLTSFLAQLARTGRTREFEMAIAAQSVAQEAAAYYMSVAEAIGRSPRDFDRLRATIPSSCRPILDPLIAILPLSDDPTRAAVRATLVEAIARCAFNSRCLDYFKKPDALTEKTFGEYLETESPTARFNQIVRRLRRGGLMAKIEDEALPLFAGRSQEQADHLLAHLTLAVVQSVLPEIVVVSIPQVVVQKYAFASGWAALLDDGKGTPFIPAPGDAPPQVVEDPETLAGLRARRFEKLDPRILTIFFETAKEDAPGLFVWIYMRQLDEAFVQLFACGVGPDGQPHRPDNFARFEGGHDYAAGVVNITTLLRALRRAPRNSLVVTFYRHCWVVFQHVTKNRPFPAFAFIGDAENELGEVVIQNFLKRPEMATGASWFGVRHEDSEVGSGFLVSQADPTRFAVVRLANDQIKMLFVRLVTEAGIPATPPEGRRYARLLEIAAWPFILGPINAERRRGEELA
jgi:hypothetical protein